MEQLSADIALAGMQDNLEAAYPPGAPMTFWRLGAEREALRRRLQYLDALRPVCKTCVNFLHVKGFNRCTVFDDVVPEAFRESGTCESWVSDGVAF